MRFIIATLGSGGDVRPYIALAHELQANKHEVAIATSFDHFDLICDYGIDCIPMKLHSEEPTSFFNTRFTNAIASTFEVREDFLKELWDVCRDAEVLIYNPSTFCCYYIAEKMRIPSFGAFVQPHHSTAAFPHPFTTNGKPWGGIFNKMGFWAYSILHWQYIRKPINRWRKETLHLPPLSFRDTLSRQMKRNKPRILYAYSRSFLPKPADWRSERAEITGYWYLEKKDYCVPPDLERFIINGTPPVFVSILYNMDKFDEDNLRQIIDLLDCRVIVQDLFGELKGLVSTEKFFYVKGSIPHEWLFKRVSAAVHHGGLGICLNCIRAGVPIVAIPAAGGNDHRFWAYVVSRAGVGTHLSIAGKSSSFAHAVARAIRKVKDNVIMKSHAMEIAGRMKDENGLKDAVKIISESILQNG
jgi:UDP:flavonoid glycosyltransferase YjiC (YdhE family)